MAHRNPILTAPINGVGVDATQNFNITWQFIGDEGEAQSSYRVKIYLASDDSLVHDSGTVSSSAEFYTVTASTLTNGNTYFYTVETNDGTTSRISRIPEKFLTLTTPTLTVDSIGSVGQFETFTATYFQAEGVEVKNYQWTLYDNLDSPLEVGSVRFGQVIQETFTGFENSTTYKVDVTVVNQNDVVITSNRPSFTTSYTIPADAPELVVTPRPEYTGINIGWQSIVVLNGTVTPGSPVYVPGKFNKGLQLTNQCLNWDLTNRLIPESFTSTFWIKLDPSHDGEFWELLKDGETVYQVGYSQEKGKFFLHRDYRFVFGIPVTIPTGFFLIGITPETAYFYSDEVSASFDTSLR